MTPEEETFITLQEPAPEISTAGTKRWYNKNGQPHRDNDLPAVIWTDGSKFWYKNGKLHRYNGLPAIIYYDGTEDYWENGQNVAPMASYFTSITKIVAFFKKMW